MKYFMTNIEIYNIFCSNKLILLYLFKEDFIRLDKHILNDLTNRCESNGMQYLYFFLPEIKEILSDERIEKISNNFSENKISINIDDEYFVNRQKGENDAYICSLIRDDLVEEFISYLNHNCIPIDGIIKPSVFETNQFLNENEPSLIQYAAFFGSIQIFRYLVFNDAELDPSLWLYVIHSNNAEMIHILEEHEIFPYDETYVKCFEESIKCHHNDIANYIYNYITLKNNLFFQRRCVEFGFQYHNYLCFPDEFHGNYVFFYLNEYNYFDIVKIYMKSLKDYFKKRRVLKSIDIHKILDYILNRI